MLTLCVMSAAPMILDDGNGNVDAAPAAPGEKGGDLYGVSDGASVDNHTQEEWLMLIGAVIVMMLIIVVAYMSIDHEEHDE